MGIAVNHFNYNGEILKYARISAIAVDVASDQVAFTLTGYKNKEARLNGGDQYQLLVHSSTLPKPHPEDLLQYAYTVLPQELPDLDWEEV